MMESIPPEPVSLVLAPCRICGRTFNPDTLSRHEGVCKRSQKTSSRRKPFDINQQRMGEQLQAFLAQRPRGTTRPRTAEERAAAKKKEWRRKHEEFIHTIRAARTVTKDGAPLPPPRPSAPNPDYVQCPHCQRRFQEYAAERHVPFCKEKYARIGRQPAGRAQESLNKRMQYKPPAIRKRPPAAHSEANPPGSSLVMKKTNFSATYDDSASRHEPVPRASNITAQRLRSQARENSTGYRADISPKPTSVPSQIPPPSNSHKPPMVVRRRSYIKREGPMLAKCPTVGSGSSQEPHSTRSRGGDATTIRGGNGSGSQLRPLSEDVVEYSNDQVYCDTSREENDYGSGHSLRGNGRSERARERRARPRGESLSSSSLPSDTELQPLGDLVRRTSGLDLKSHDPSIEMTGRVSSGNNRRVHLNQHGMPMSKYCYECGAKYPVPQAKYCCECGTKRI